MRSGAGAAAMASLRTSSSPLASVLKPPLSLNANVLKRPGDGATYGSGAFATGRSGSTSILEGLNALPGVALAGENYAMLTDAQEARTLRASHASRAPPCITCITCPVMHYMHHMLTDAQ